VTLAAIDVGTNSLHLVVARIVDDRHFEVVGAEKEMVRLGTGSGDMKRLDPAAMDRGIAALARFRRIADIHDAPVRAVATSAVREAENHDEFLARARAEAGVEVEVISGVEEARLIHLGVLQALPVFTKRSFVCDIGGGSTEVMVGEHGELLTARSFKLGAVRLTNRFFPGERLHPAAVQACRTFVRRAARTSCGPTTGSASTQPPWMQSFASCRGLAPWASGRPYRGWSRSVQTSSSPAR
jgi:exopolyphosphatase/guanosine-5'-triphosphate,3'-diphosphate pyrophosphatase